MAFWKSYTCSLILTGPPTTGQTCWQKVGIGREEGIDLAFALVFYLFLKWKRTEAHTEGVEKCILKNLIRKEIVMDYRSYPH